MFSALHESLLHYKSINNFLFTSFQQKNEVKKGNMQIEFI